MPGPTTTEIWGAEAWAPTLISALSQESAVLRAGARRIVAPGRVIHVPRLKVLPRADWVGELVELPSDAGVADTLVLTPRKIGNVVSLSQESIADAPIGELNAVGEAMVRGCAARLDSRFFSNSAATPTAPAGLLNTATYSLPTGTGAGVTIPRLIQAIGAIAGAGGEADVIFLAAEDLTAVRLEALTGGFRLTGDPTAPGIQRVGGARLIPAPLPAGTAVVAEARYIALGIRQDATVSFSNDARFTQDAVAAKVTMRVDYAPSDPAAFFVLKTT